MTISHQIGSTNYYIEYFPQRPFWGILSIVKKTSKVIFKKIEMQQIEHVAFFQGQAILFV